MGDAANQKAIVRHGVRALASTLPRVTAPIFKKRGFAEAGILTDWPAIVGELLARHTAPERIAFTRGSRQNGTLHIVCESAFAPELQHLAPKVIERINGYFGYPAVGQLRIQQGRVPKRAEKPAVQPVAKVPASGSRSFEGAVAAGGAVLGISDDGLRAALTRLGDAVARKQR